MDEFDRQMKFLAETASLVSLRELSSRVSSGKSLPARPVAVTFDDSFRNIRETALPILRAHGIPATFFVSTGFVGTHRRFWVDIVEHAVNYFKSSSLEIRLNGVVQSFDIAIRERRIESVTVIKAAMKKMPPARRAEALSELISVTGVDDGGDGVSNYENMDWDDVRALDEGEYEVGGHTVNHEIMAYLNDEDLEYEIGTCLNDLAENLGHSVDLFSYPEGQADHYDERTISRLKAHGVKVCPSAIGGINPHGTDPFHLRRIMVGFMGEPFPVNVLKAGPQ